jgi:hypothetical protein
LQAPAPAAPRPDAVEANDAPVNTTPEPPKAPTRVESASEVAPASESAAPPISAQTLSWHGDPTPGAERKFRIRELVTVREGLRELETHAAQLPDDAKLQRLASDTRDRLARLERWASDHAVTSAELEAQIQTDVLEAQGSVAR